MNMGRDEASVFDINRKRSVKGEGEKRQWWVVKVLIMKIKKYWLRVLI